jgi:chromosome partitioning protein
MPIPASLNQKGEVGRTTLATNIATALALQKKKVPFIHADQRGSALDWSAARKGKLLFPVVGLPKDTLHREIPTLGSSYDWVVIDGPRVSTT